MDASRFDAASNREQRVALEKAVPAAREEATCKTALSNFLHAAVARLRA